MSRPLEHAVILSAEERDTLQRLVGGGHNSATIIRRARILLLADRGDAGPRWGDEQIATAVGATSRTVSRIRSRFSTARLGAIERAKHRRYKPRKLDGEAEARLIALVCGPPPEGHAQWSLRLLADRLVWLEIVDSIGHEAVRRVLKKTNLSLGRNNAGVSPPNTTPPGSAASKKS